MRLSDNEMIRAESNFSIAVHWALAVSCLLLTLSGFGFLFQIQIIGTLFGGFPMMKHLHNWLGVVFTIALTLSMKTWLKEAIHFSKDDIQWFMVGGGYLGKFLKGHVPPMHKLNPGQKMFYLSLLGLGAGIIASGFVIWLFPNNQGWMVWSHLIHNLCFIGISIFLPIHIYLGSIGYPGTLRIMTHGTVPVWWARKKAPLWVKEVEEGKSH